MGGSVAIEGVEALRDALVAVGLDAHGPSPTGDDHGVDLIVTSPAGGRVLIRLKRVSLASTDGLNRRLASWRHPGPDNAVGVVVADRVTSEARALLEAAGWGWFDLRGHLHIAGEGLFIDTDLPALRGRPGRVDPIAGHVGVEVAAQLLLNPDEPAAVRRIARSIGRAPSSVSQVLASMHKAGLVDDGRRPVVPELFWELAAHWHPSAADIQSLPSPGDGAVNHALRLGFENVEETIGWALTDTLAAVAYGAPVSARSDQPPDFYVPDAATLRRAVKLLGEAGNHNRRAATVRVAPVAFICSRRVDASSWGNEFWPLAQPLFVALDLARDPGRGREILESWTPGDRGRRVW